MNVTNLLSIIGATLGIAGVIGGSAGVLMAGRQKGTVGVLKEDNEALRGRVDTQAGEVQALRATEARCQERLDGLEQANRVMQEIVTGAAAVEALRDTIAANHAELLSVMRDGRGS